LGKKGIEDRDKEEKRNRWASRRDSDKEKTSREVTISGIQDILQGSVENEHIEVVMEKIKKIMY
jgi:hypothetical protein